MLLHKPPYNMLQFINILPLPNIYTFKDIDPFLHPHPIFSTLLNLNFLTSWTQKFQLDKFLPQALSPTQNEPKEPKRSQIDLHFDHETGVHVLLEDPACRWFDLAYTNFTHFFQKLTNWTKLLKSPENHVKLFQNQKSNAATLNTQLLAPNICTFWDTEQFV